MRRLIPILLVAFPFFAQAQLAPEVEGKIGAATQRVLRETGAPSATVGILQGGKIVYARAFGKARLRPSKPAAPEDASPIGSISKQFTASAVLLLQERGKLSVDDPVSKYFPNFTRANDVKLRNLLTMTSGYQDYAPQDYTIPEWKNPGDPLKIVTEYATKPLDFDPGTEYQYSNTNYVLLALIVQQVAGEPFYQFLKANVLEPTHVMDVLNLNTDQAMLKVTGYMRNGLAPLRPAILEAPGWYLGDGDLAMPVRSLLTWDQHFIDKTLLSPESFSQMETPFQLSTGKPTLYGFGTLIVKRNGRVELVHDGEVGGFTAFNAVFPDDKTAIAVYVNQEATDAGDRIAGAIIPIVIGPALERSSDDPFAPELKTALEALAKGDIDRSKFTANCNSYFDPTAMADYKSSLAPLGSIKSVELLSKSQRGGMNFGDWKVTYSKGTSINVTTFLLPDGKIEQLLVVGKI